MSIGCLVMMLDNSNVSIFIFHYNIQRDSCCSLTVTSNYLEVICMSVNEIFLTTVSVYKMRYPLIVFIYILYFCHTLVWKWPLWIFGIMKEYVFVRLKVFVRELIWSNELNGMVTECFTYLWSSITLAQAMLYITDRALVGVKLHSSFEGWRL